VLCRGRKSHVIHHALEFSPSKGTWMSSDSSFAFPAHPASLYTVCLVQSIPVKGSKFSDPVSGNARTLLKYTDEPQVHETA
jgi:hypothetical protein